MGAPHTNKHSIAFVLLGPGPIVPRPLTEGPRFVQEHEGRGPGPVFPRPLTGGPRFVQEQKSQKLEICLWRPRALKVKTLVRHSTGKCQVWEPWPEAGNLSLEARGPKSEEFSKALNTEVPGLGSLGRTWESASGSPGGGKMKRLITDSIRKCQLWTPRPGWPERCQVSQSVSDTEWPR